LPLRVLSSAIGSLFPALVNQIRPRGTNGRNRWRRVNWFNHMFMRSCFMCNCPGDNEIDRRVKAQGGSCGPTRSYTWLSTPGIGACIQSSRQQQRNKGSFTLAEPQLKTTRNSFGNFCCVHHTVLCYDQFIFYIQQLYTYI
jgi:hypothetical protein